VRLAITGAAGRVADLLRPALAGDTVRVVDCRPALGWGNADVITGDLSDPAIAASTVDGADAVLHLAGNPNPLSPWADLLRPNIEATVAVLEAARAAGVHRVVLASSVHALGGWLQPGAGLVDPQSPAWPCCPYGATKAFAEAAGAATAHASHTSVVCLRLGGCRPVPPTLLWARTWIGPDDLRALVTAALTADLRYGIYTGVSANADRLFAEGTAGADLGWWPRQNSADLDVPPGDGGLCPPAPGIDSV
jgi:NAD dependent epimerase/dehydratase family